MVLPLWVVENRPSPLLWPLAYTTACTTVQAVIVFKALPAWGTGCRLTGWYGCCRDCICLIWRYRRKQQPATQRIINNTKMANITTGITIRIVSTQTFQKINLSSGSDPLSYSCTSSSNCHAMLCTSTAYAVMQCLCLSRSWILSKCVIASSDFFHW